MNTTRKTLGRGLGDLMSEVAQAEKPLAASIDRAFLQIPVESFPGTEDGAGQPPERSDTLVQSLKVHGVLQPILVRRQESGYAVIDGRKRLQAARELGMKTIPALVLNNPGADSAVLASEANRRIEGGPPSPAPVPEPPTPIRIIAPVPDWRRDWRLPSAFAAAAGMALVLGIGGTLWLSRGVPEPLPVVPGPVEASSEQSADAPAAVPDAGVGGIAAAEPAEPAAPEREAPPWIADLSMSGVQATWTNEAIVVAFDRPIFARYAALAPDSGQILRGLAAVFARSEAALRIRICGHTDDTPVRAGGPYADNFAVGMARAVRVVEFLRREGGLTNVDFVVASAGESNPVHPNDSVEGRQKNRTVTLEVEEAVR